MPHRGLLCPACGHRQLKVRFTRRSRPGAVTRVRECRSCGHRVRTAERIENRAA